MPNPGECYHCGRIVPLGRGTCARCGGPPHRDWIDRTVARSTTRPCLTCAHREECPEASEFAWSCYYDNHPEVEPLS